MVSPEKTVPSLFTVFHLVGCQLFFSGQVEPGTSLGFKLFLALVKQCGLFSDQLFFAVSKQL